MRNPQIKRSDGYARLAKDWQLSGFMRSISDNTACAVRRLFTCTDRACDAAPENAFFRTDFFERDAMGSISGHPISWEAEAVL